MLGFLDEYSYILTFGILVMAIIAINFTNGKFWLIKKRAIIAPIFATLQFILYIATFIYRMQDYIWYYVLLHDLCPMISFFSIIIFYLDKEKLYKATMPWFIIGSVMTIFTGEAPIFSSPVWLISYFEHIMMLMQGVLAYFWVSKYSWKEILSTLILPTFLVSWNLLTALLPWKMTGDSRWAFFSTGLLEPSIVPGQAFSILNEIPWMPYPASTILFYILAVGIAFMIAANKKYYPKFRDKVFFWIKEKFFAQNTKNIRENSLKEKA